MLLERSAIAKFNERTVYRILARVVDVNTRLLMITVHLLTSTVRF